MHGNFSGKAVLIIDDDDEMAHAIACVMKNAGYRVRRACDGDEGLQMAAQERPDLILLDFMMPVKNGFDVCHEIRQNPVLADVPVLAVTAFGQDICETYDTAQKDVPMNIFDYLEKPVEPNVLLERVALALASVGS